MTNSENLPLLIFDLDGTLIDSAGDIHIAPMIRAARMAAVMVAAGMGFLRWVSSSPTIPRPPGAP